MDHFELSDLMKKIYREKIEQEIRRPELAREKEQFIASHFSAEPAGMGIFSGRMIPEFLSPALALLLVFGVFNSLVPVEKSPRQAPLAILTSSAPGLQPAALKSAGGVQPRKEDAKQMKKLLGKAQKIKPERPVIVKRVSSQVGSTMVYHKKHEETPITVVWVFTKGQGV